jgi:catechol 2,3-dioxygenase-like lactoylglutathione lyase family enzyme
MRSVTVGVSDLAAALRLFHDVMGLKIESRGELTRERRAAWGLSSTRSAQLVELSCQGYPIGRLRLLALEPRATEVVRRDPGVGGTDSPLDIGPKAIDFYVRSPAELYWQEMVDAGCVARSKPVRHVIGGAESEEAVLFGPDGVPLLIMVGHRHPATQMREGTPHGRYSEVATMSVVCGELAATRRFYGEALGLVTGTDEETAESFREKVNELVGIPRGSRVHFLLYQDPAEPSGKILLVYFGGVHGKRLTGRMHPSRLGVGLFTHMTTDLDELERRVRHAGARIESLPALIDGERSMLVRGPNEELFEFVESGGRRP